LTQSINGFNAETLAIEATELVKIEPTFSFCDASGQYAVRSLSWSSYEHQIYSLDVAIKATAALIYKFIYDVSEEVYVRPSYNGVEDGSIAHPFNTLAEAVQELSERPTKRVIKLPKGVYSDKLVIDKPSILQPWSVEE